MEFYLERNNKDIDMIEIFTKHIPNRIYAWGMLHSDFFLGVDGIEGLLDKLDFGPVKVKMEIAE